MKRCPECSVLTSRKPAFDLYSFFEHIYHVQLFPRQIQIGSAKVTISRYLLIDGSLQIEILDDCRRTQVEVFLYDFCDFFIGKLACAIGIYQNGNGLCHADCVRKLYLTFSCNAAGNDIFRNVSCRIASGTVNLCGVLTGECAAAMCRIAAIRKYAGKISSKCRN